KNPERPHVPQQMNPAAVQKHGAEEGEELLVEAEVRGHIGPRVTGGNDRKLDQHLLEMRAGLQFLEKNQDVERDDAQRHRRKTRRRDVVTQRKHNPKFTKRLGYRRPAYSLRIAKSSSTVIRWWAAMLLRMPLSLPVLIER